MKMLISKGKIITAGHLFLIILAGFIVYANSLNGKFVWDDYFYVRDNSHIRNYSYLFQVFSERVGAGYTDIAVPSNFYRPLQTLTYMLDYSFWGLETFGYHLTNIILHTAAGLCLYWLIAIIFASRTLAWVTSLFYIVHPAHVEAVASISGRADSLSAIFILLAFIFYIKIIASFNIPFFLLFLFSFICALLSKESAVAFLPILLLYHWAFGKKIKLNLFYLSLITFSLYVLVRTIVLGSSPLETNNLSGLFYRVPGFFVALVTYIRILFLPIGLHVHYGDLLFKFSDKKTLLGMLIFALLLLYALKNKEKNRLAFFSICWYFIFFLPLANIYRINDSFMKEHWLYLPSVGFFLILANGLLGLYNNKSTKTTGLLCIVLIVIFYSFCTIKQNQYWQNPVVFLRNSLKYLPDYSTFYSELGREYENLGKLEEAARFYQEAAAKNPNLIGNYYNAGTTYAKTGRYPEAIANYSKALSNNPEDLQVYYIIAGYYDKLGMKIDAKNMRERARRERLELSQKYRQIGDRYKEADNWKEAVVSYKKSLEFTPGDLSLYNELGSLYVIIGNFKEAVKSFTEALKIDPSCAVVHNNLAAAYYYQKQYDLAVRHCDIAIELGYKVEPGFLQKLKLYR